VPRSHLKCYRSWRYSQTEKVQIAPALEPQLYINARRPFMCRFDRAARGWARNRTTFTSLSPRCASVVQSRPTKPGKSCPRGSGHPASALFVNEAEWCRRLLMAMARQLAHGHVAERCI
jgi:hypothetical protein